MGDPEDPTAADPAGGAPAADAPQDPVQAAKDEAWLAQFRADNAAKVMEYDFQATAATQAEEKGAEAERTYDLHMADKLAKDAATSRTDASADDKKAEKTPSRHDEYAAQAETERHMAVAADESSGRFHGAAQVADTRAKELTVEVTEEYKHFQQDRSEYENLQEQAIAAQRIATDEAKLPHPGDPAPADPPAGQPQP